MRKLLNKPWFVAILAVSAVAFVGHSLMPQNIAQSPITATASSPVESGESEDPSIVAEAAPSNGKDDLSSPNLFPFKRDPFTPSVRIAAQRAIAQEVRPDIIETAHLSAIWSQNGSIFVLINGQIHQPGDEIGRLKIESASLDGVWVSHWKGRDHLNLGAQFTLNTPAVMANPPATAL